jgi:hypothetical protein
MNRGDDGSGPVAWIGMAGVTAARDGVGESASAAASTVAGVSSARSANRVGVRDIPSSSVFSPEAQRRRG